MPSAKMVAVRNAPLTAKLTVQVRNGYHVNSNAPADEYLIPLKLTWDESALKAVETAYPKPEVVNYSFSPKPLSVYSGQFDIVTRFQVPSGSALGPSVLVGKLRYQACNDSMCLPPKVVEVKLPLDIRAQ